MAFQIYRKKEGESDSAYVLITEIDDASEIDDPLQPATTYLYKLEQPPFATLYATATTLAAGLFGLYVQPGYVNEEYVQ